MKRVGIYFVFLSKILCGAVFAFLLFAVITDAGKNSLLSAFSFVAKKYYSIDLNFSKLHNNRIDRITATNQAGTVYHIDNFTFSFSPKILIEADNVNINSKKLEQNVDLTELIFKIKTALPILHKYVNVIKIKDLNGIKNFSYISQNRESHCSAIVNNKSINLSITGQKCIVFVEDEYQNITLSFDDLFKEKIRFNVKSNNDLIDASGIITGDLSKLELQGVLKKISFSANASVIDGIMNFSAHLSRFVPNNRYLPIDTTIKANGICTLKNRSFDVQFSVYSKDKLLFNGTADYNNNVIKTSVTFNDWRIASELTFAENILQINKVQILHPALKIRSTKMILLNIKQYSNIFDVVKSGGIEFQISNLKLLKELPYMLPTGQGTGHIYLDEQKLKFNLKSKNLSYNGVEFYGLSGQYSSDNNLKILFDDVIFKEHKISDLLITKNGEILKIRGKIDDKGHINVDARLKPNKAIIDILDIHTKNLSLDSKNVDIAYPDNNVKVISDVINVFNGTASIDFQSNNGNKNLKVSVKHLSLKNMLFFINSKERQLFKDAFVNADLTIYNKKNKYLGIACIDITNNNSEIILDSTIKLLDDGVFIVGKYAGRRDFIEASIYIPTYISSGFQMVKIENKELSGLINASINLQKFQLLSTTDRLTLKGQLETQLSLAVSGNTPILSGSCSVSDGLVETPSVSVRNIFLNASVKNNYITLNRAISSHKKGTMNITGGGKFVVDDIIPQIICNMDVTFNNYNLLSSDTLTCDFNGTIKATGPVQKLKLKGQLIASNGVYDTSHVNPLYRSDIEVRGLSKNKIKALELDIAKTKKTPFTFDIATKCKNFRVTGKSVEAALNGDLNVVTFRDSLALDGELKLDTGYINMVGVRIKLRDGFVRFIKEYGIMPLINLHGNSIVKDMQIFLDIDNTKGKNLAIDIRSNPSYSIENIFSKIVFNKPLIGLKLAESARIHNAVKNLKQQPKNAFSYFDFIKELMIFDSFSFSNDETVNAKNGASTLKAGKYISDNIYIGVEKATEKETKYKVAINISPQVRVEANSNGEAGITWMYRY